MASLRSAFPSSRPAPERAFTLVELLEVAAITGLVLWAASSSIVSHIRSTSSQEAIARLRDHWGRFSYFLDTEIGEADQAVGTNGCAAAASGLVFSLQVPTLLTNPAFVQIDYYNKSGGVWRCGPPIRQDGSLQLPTSENAVPVLVDNLLVDRATLSLQVPLATNPREPQYTLALTDPTGAAYSQSGSNRTRVRTFTETQVP